MSENSSFKVEKDGSGLCVSPDPAGPYNYGVASSRPY
jgi:hypothetical protein